MFVSIWNLILKKKKEEKTNWEGTEEDEGCGGRVNRDDWVDWEFGEIDGVGLVDDEGITKIDGVFEIEFETLLVMDGLIDLVVDLVADWLFDGDRLEVGVWVEVLEVDQLGESVRLEEADFDSDGWDVDVAEFVFEVVGSVEVEEVLVKVGVEVEVEVDDRVGLIGDELELVGDFVDVVVNDGVDEVVARLVWVEVVVEVGLNDGLILVDGDWLADWLCEVDGDVDELEDGMIDGKLEIEGVWVWVDEADRVFEVDAVFDGLWVFVALTVGVAVRLFVVVDGVV